MIVEQDNIPYSIRRIRSAADTFRRLSDTYQKLSADVPSYAPATMAIAVQLNEMAAVLDEYTGCGSVMENLDLAKKNQIEKQFQSRGIRVENVRIIERSAGHLELVVGMQSVRRKGNITPHEAAAIISKCMKKEYISVPENRYIINNNMNDFTFTEGGRFDVVYGVARANKNGNAVSGDNFSVSSPECGKVIINLVDGMGSGQAAFEESRRVVELLEQSMEAGFSEESSINLINSVFSVGDMVGVPVTVDMCVIDTFQGICSCIKLGAVSTYIKRKGWVDVIQSDTMPIGVLPEIDYDSTVKKLYDGDYIVMVSDGVMEALPFLEKEEILMELISGAKKHNPEQMAWEILNDALNYIGEYPCDDMTVIVAGVYERTQMSLGG